MKKNRIPVLFFLVLSVCVLMAACKGKEAETTPPDDPTVEDPGIGTDDTGEGGTEDPEGTDDLPGGDDSGLPDDDDGNNGDNDPVDDSKVEPIDIYSIDDTTLETTTVTAMVDTTGGLTINAVVEAVGLALEDHGLTVQINQVTQENKKVTIDIKADNASKPFGDAGSSVETTILDCITYSIFDNFEDCKEVYFTVNGAEYQSGHIYLKKGEPYAVNE